MDIKGLRALNLIGTILFALIGCLLPVSYSVGTLVFYNNTCRTILFVWFCIILIFALLFYRFTVIGLDRGEYKAVKQWTLVGIIVGFMGGIIPLIIFIVSYVSFDDAVRNQFYGPVYHYYPQPQSQIRYCNSCREQIPVDSRLCPYCGEQLAPMRSKRNRPPPPQRRGNRKMKYY